MKDFRLVLGVLLKNYFRGGKGTRGRMSQGLVMALAMSPLLIMLCVMLAMLARVTAAQNLLPQLINAVVSASQMLVFFFIIRSVISLLYMSEDTEFLSALPVKASSVFFARLAQIYLSEAAIAFYILVPSLLTIGISAAAAGVAVFPGFYPLVLLIALLTPFLPLVAVTILSMPLMWISSFFKRRSAFSSVVSVLLYAALFAAYFAIIPNMGSVSEIDQISQTAANALNTFSNVMYPNKVLIELSLGINAGVNFGIFAGIYLGLAALIIGLSAVFYRKAAAAQIETRSAANGKAAEASKRKNVVTALAIRDFKMLIRFPSLTLSTFSGTVLAPIMLAVMYAMSGNAYVEMIPTTEGVTANAELIQLGFVFLMSLMLNAGMNYSAGLAYTREGKTFYMTKHLPVSAKDSVLSKLLFSEMVSVVGMVPLVFIAIFLIKIGVVSALLYGLCFLIFCTGFNCFEILLDMRRPNVDWTVTSEIQRNSYYILLPFCLSILLGIVLMVTACAFATLESVLGTVGAFGCFWATAFVIAGITAAVFGMLLKRYGRPFFERIGEYRHKTVVRAPAAFGGKGRGGMLG